MCVKASGHERRSSDLKVSRQEKTSSKLTVLFQSASCAFLEAGLRREWSKNTEEAVVSAFSWGGWCRRQGCTVGGHASRDLNSLSIVVVLILVRVHVDGFLELAADGTRQSHPSRL